MPYLSEIFRNKPNTLKIKLSHGLTGDTFKLFPDIITVIIALAAFEITLLENFAKSNLLLIITNKSFKVFWDDSLNHFVFD